MKRVIIYLLVLLVLSVCDCYAQTDTTAVVYFDRNFRAEKEMEYVWYYGIPRKVKDNRYEVTFYRLSGEKIAFGEYTGKRLKTREGAFIIYNLQGNKIISSNYHNSLLHGAYEHYFINGSLSDSGRMDGGSRVGIWKSWHSNMQLNNIRVYALARGRWGSQYSVLEKEYKSWFPNGSLQDSGFYKNNNREGIWVEWLDGGLVRSVGRYKKNWKRGMWRYYNTKGKLLYMRRFSSFKYDELGEYIPVQEK